MWGKLRALFVVVLAGVMAPTPAVAEPSEDSVPWSVNVHIWPGDDREQITKAIATAEDLGVKYLRTDFWWYEVAPEPGVIDEKALDYYDWVVDTAADHGLGVVANLAIAPDWAAALYQSGDRDAFARSFGEYTRAVAARVGDRVDYYQLWNEPNHVNDFVDHDGDIMLFQSGHDGLSAEDSSVKVIVNLLVDGHDSPQCPNWSCDFKYYFDNGAASSIDIIGIDHYPDTWSAGSWGGNLVDRLFALGSELDRPVAIMETGYSTAGCAPAGNSEQGQVDWINSQLPMMRDKIAGRALTLINWYELDDGDTSLDNCYADPIGAIEAHFGVTHTDLSPKPGFEALRDQIAGFRDPD